MKRSLFTVSAIALAVLTGCNSTDEVTAEQPLYVSTVAVDVPVKSQYRTFKGQVVPAEQTPIAFRCAGEVQHVLVKAGDTVKEGQMIAKLDDSKEKQAVNDAEAQYMLAMVNPNTQSMSYQPQATFLGDAKSYALDYLEHTSEPNAQTHTYQMYLTMPQPEQEILPGTSVSVAVDMVAAGITSIDGYNIPMTALQAGSHAGEFFVWKLNGDAVTKVEVSIDQVNGEGAIVSSGVAQGDVLVNSSLRKLREGKHVDVVEKQQ
ncbi:biotin/lipoyl-binding protein [Vibrio campbellii]|uniref:Uncharacterized protein n=1 Tax=Vibrio campbellii (strain ATCC BAA-1116) TaxID=2902295 RepID=A7N8H1_VIBC1|nr:biotin/lipoyl-binding protein [Vibrio campbellii]ABU73857.1 hypothetical protein VIBHAR_05964 [Vibrio campbellii ATCC BAA-1116]AGU98532.1 hypothetical protein M892_21995 [Vibrio campbellii ATCC BAA-1116]MBT0121105.1 biotin/lipoyl-binding protein [Vibrio campbellii]MBT0136213.1 biotin/lipoyl-binding protein [Vibrio campbellii]MBT0140873.1 biotin/lipoyl-binding protein [Vibrio campbellii]